MPPHSLGSGTISFGLVSIPVKLYTAAGSASVSFNMLHAKCGSRIKQQTFCPVCQVTIERNELVRGYEFAKDQYVRINDEELKSLEGEASKVIDIAEFVPLDQVDPIYFEKTYYLGPDKGGDKAYVLLSESMKKKKVVAVGRWAARGKEQLVIVRPYEDGLILHQLFYANEVRAFEEIEGPAKLSFTEKERDLALKLIDQLTSDAFEAEKYHDTYSDKVREAVEQKVAGQEITIAPEAPRAQIIDLFDALKKTLAEGPKPPPSVLKGGPKKTEPKSDAEAAPKKKRAKG
jgi:DNA end-binding protein Ku